MGPKPPSDGTNFTYWVYMIGMVGLLLYQCFIGLAIFLYDIGPLTSSFNKEDFDDVLTLGIVFAVLALPALAFMLFASCMLCKLVNNAVDEKITTEHRSYTDDELQMTRFASIQRWLHVGFTLGWYLFIALSVVNVSEEMETGVGFAVLVFLLSLALAGCMFIEIFLYWKSWKAFSDYVKLHDLESPALEGSSLGYEPVET